MTQSTVCRFLTRTKQFYNTHHFHPRLITYHGQKKSITSALYRTSEVAGKSSISAKVLARQWKQPQRNKIIIPALSCYNCQKRWFHLSPRRQVAFPPLIWAFVKFAAKLGAIFTGRGLRLWLKNQPKDVRAKYYKLLLAKIIGLISLSGVFGTVYYYKHQQEAPITHRKRFISLTPEQYLKVADFEAENFMEQFKENTLPATHPYYDIVVNIARQLVAANQDFPGMSEHQWTISVIKSDEKNAFVLPNGYVFVFTGLIEFVDNKDQLAMVIGHEMAHALMLHAAEQLSYTQLLDYLVVLVMAAIWFVMPSDGIAVISQWFYNKVMDVTVHMPYSRKLEREADIVGLQLASKACYDVREGSVFWEKMNIASRLSDSNIPEWASTHPTHEKRVETFDFLLPKAIEQREKSHCPALPQCDPRDGIKQLRLKVDDVKTAQKARVNLHQVQRIKDKESFFPGLRGSLAAEGGNSNVNARIDDDREVQTKIHASNDSQIAEKVNDSLMTDRIPTEIKLDRENSKDDQETKDLTMKETFVDIKEGEVTVLDAGKKTEDIVADTNTIQVNSECNDKSGNEKEVKEESAQTDKSGTERHISRTDGIDSNKNGSIEKSHTD